jgi:protein O-GlcNAc transferase
MGIVLRALNRPADALQRFTEALAINAAAAETWNSRGEVLNDLQRHTEAVADFDKAVSLNPRYAQALCNKGKSLVMLRRRDEASAAFEKAVELDPAFAEAWYCRAVLLCEGKRFDDALAAIKQALAPKPDVAVAWLCAGNILFRLRYYDRAIAAYQRALALKPGYTEACSNRGTTLLHLKRIPEAIAAFEETLALKPDAADAHLGKGVALFEAGRYRDAIAAFVNALAFCPEFAEARLGLGNSLAALERWSEALGNFDKAFHLNPELPYAEGARLNAKLVLCDWTNLESEIAHLLEAIERDKLAIAPFSLMALPSSPSHQLACARTFVREQAIFPKLWRDEAYSHERIRVAYVSADFREHATAFLTAGLFEGHDRSRFEITAISLGPDDNSDIRRRIKSACDHFIDVRHNSDQEVAELIRKHDHTKFYAEEVIWLPETYQINDNRRPIAERIPSRAECGLPEPAFVFCCFNNNYKIMPEIFDIWMRLLRGNCSPPCGAVTRR